MLILFILSILRSFASLPRCIHRPFVLSGFHGSTIGGYRSALSPHYSVLSQGGAGSTVPQ